MELKTMCAFLYRKDTNYTFLECTQNYKVLKDLGISPCYFILTTANGNVKFKTFDELWYKVHADNLFISILEVKAYRKIKLKSYNKIWH